jgi:hypothetical protein
MSKPKVEYFININYPERKNDMLELRRRLANAYMSFVENYILTLPISDEEKNKLYIAVKEKIKSR